MAKQQLKQPSESLFTQADYQSLRAARAALNNLIPTLDKAKACGVDCTMYHQMRDDIDAQLAAIEQHFMGGMAGGKVKM